MRLLALAAVIGLSVGCGRPVAEHRAAANPGSPSAAIMTPDTPPPSPTPDATPSVASSAPAPPNPAPPPPPPPPCAIVLKSLTAQSGSVAGKVNLTWAASGGCPPFNGTIAGNYVGGSPHRYWIILVTAQTGSYTDSPPIGSAPSCLASIYYALAFPGQNPTAQLTARADNVKIC